MKKPGYHPSKKTDKLERRARKYGRDDTMYCFEWKEGGPMGGGCIGCATAPNMRVALKRVIVDHHRVNNVHTARTLLKALKQGTLKELVVVSISKLDHALVWSPVKK